MYAPRGLGACTVKDPATGQNITMLDCGENVTVTPDETIYTDLATGKSIVSMKTDWLTIGLAAAAVLLTIKVISQR